MTDATPQATKPTRKQREQAMAVWLTALTAYNARGGDRVHEKASRDASYVVCGGLAAERAEQAAKSTKRVETLEQALRERDGALERVREYIRIAMKPESVKAACCETAWDRAHRDGLKHGLNAVNAEFAKVGASHVP